MLWVCRKETDVVFFPPPIWFLTSAVWVVQQIGLCCCRGLLQPSPVTRPLSPAETLAPTGSRPRAALRPWSDSSSLASEARRRAYRRPRECEQIHQPVTSETSHMTSTTCENQDKRWYYLRDWRVIELLAWWIVQKSPYRLKLMTWSSSSSVFEPQRCVLISVVLILSSFHSWTFICEALFILTPVTGECFTDDQIKME